MITQVELELDMYDHGKARANRILSGNEEGGRAANNPYAQAIFRRYVLPLADIIQEDLESKRPGRRKAHVVLLEGMDPQAIAYLSVRNVLNIMLSGANKDVQARDVVTQVGKSIFHEKCLGLFEEAEPKLFYTLVNDLDRRMSKSERHRMVVFKRQAQESGVPFPEWGLAGVTQVGSYVVDQLEKLGLLETKQWIDKSKAKIDIRLTPDTLELVGSIKGHIIETMPYFLPCVEKPKDWTSISEGGFHTKEMRRMQPFAVRSQYLRSEEDFDEGNMDIPLAAINALQSTPWQINGRMLDTIREIAKHYDMDEILSQAEFPAPHKPDWLGEDMKSEDMNPQQLEEFVAWKREKAEWFTQMKLRGTKYGRFYTATTVADKFRSFPAIYFVYFADFRGRLYAQTTGVSPQGSDMQKALLRFAYGKTLSGPDAVKWFLIHGANKWGFDKASLDDRAKWHEDKQELLLSFADNPVANRGWQEADVPLQFLSWCFEYADWVRNPDTFVSHTPIGMDGSCNGLQNFSAMLRDERGGRATNLVPADLPNDIYQMVADVTRAKLEAKRHPPDDHDEHVKLERWRDMWLKHGINRTLVKRSVMTLPYGSTRFSCADFIVSDYLKMGKAPEFEKAEYRPAAQYLSHFVWDAIGEVVVKAREAMKWLQQSTKGILNTNELIRWTSPSGFPVVQGYAASDEHRIRTNLCGSAFLRTYKETQRPDANRHRNGVAPNFIHSFDAAHLHLVAVAATAAGMDLAMIHDDYGTHAADAQEFYEIIREEFIGMYSMSDPLQEFADKYSLSSPPEKGTLDLELVRESLYFFS